MKFFKPEDFIEPGAGQFLLTGEMLASLANAKLEREGRVVYSQDDGQFATGKWMEKICSESRHSNKALLINIEPIEKCTHPAEKVHEVFGGRTQDQFYGFECECGIKVKAKVFEAE